MKDQTKNTISRTQRVFLNLSCLYIACKTHKWHIAQIQIKGITRVLTGH